MFSYEIKIKHNILLCSDIESYLTVIKTTKYIELKTKYILKFTVDRHLDLAWYLLLN